jgi:catechol 2,3-dioxygenase-like lactoylglutathione lyase family enzyme
MIRTSHVCLWVNDQDEAKAFYTEKLGFDVREDVTMEGWRWLTVSPPSQPEVEIALNTPGPPAMDPDTADKVRELVALGAMGGLILHTDDCKGDYERLSALGVEFTQEPNERFYGIDSGFRDPSGNSFRLVQPVEQPANA